MKATLLFLVVFVAVSHQQYNYRNYRMMFSYPWFVMPLPQQPEIFNNEFGSSNQDVHSEEDGAIVGSIGSSGRHNIALFDEEEEFPDIQSRIKDISRYRTRPYYSNNDQKARFFFNLPNNGVSSSAFNNPLFKTAFFTSTVTLSLNSVQNCVPFTEAVANIAACRRRRQFNHSAYNDEEQFAIAPSETLKMTPTVLSSSQLRNSNSQLSSSKDDASLDEMSTLDYHLREKRFFINKNQFVVTSYSTSFVFVNSTITRTVNLLTNIPAIILGPAACDPAVVSVCVKCLPPGFVVCPNPAG